eukprot:TCONS_00024915-protein
MSTVPVFAWVICNVYSEDLITKPLNTCTELYMYACFVFLRKHLQGVSTQGYDNLLDMLNDNNVIDCIYSLMTLSVKTYMQNQVLFSEEEVRQLNCPVHLEQTGLIVNYNRGEMREPIYQYKHLVLQEFLTGLYLCVTKGMSPYLTNRELSSCAPVIFGIGRLLKENDFFIKFFQRLSNLHTTKSTFFRRIFQPYRTWVFNKYLTRNTLEIPDCMVGPNSLLIDSTIPECQEFMTSLYEGRLKIECPFSTVTIESDLNEIDVRNAIFLIDHLNLKLKVPERMLGTNHLIIDTTLKECEQWTKVLMKSNSIIVDCPFTRTYIHCETADIESVLFLVQRLNLTLKLPNLMSDHDTLIIYGLDVECARFMEIVYRTEAKVECPFSEVEIYEMADESQLVDQISFFIEHLHLILKVPNCMIGSDTIIINTDFPECKAYIKAIFELKLQPVYQAASSIEIHCDVSYEYVGLVTYIIKSSNLELKIPNCMLGFKSLIIDSNVDSCRSFVDFIAKSKCPVECSYSTAEVKALIKGGKPLDVINFLEAMNLKLKIPIPMLGNKSLIVDSNVGFYRDFNDKECHPFSTAENYIRYWDYYLSEVATFLESMDLKLKLKIPSCMKDQRTLIIDAEIPEFKLISNVKLRERLTGPKTQFEKVEIKSDLQPDDLDTVIFLLEQNSVKVIKLPHCMIGATSLIINSHLKECRGFLKLFTAMNLWFDNLPFDVVEIRSDLSGEDMLRVESLFTHIKTVSQSERVELKLKIPSQMLGPRSFIIDIDKRQCRRFLWFFHQSKTKPMCRCDLPFNGVEIQSEPLDSISSFLPERRKELIDQIKLFITRFALKLRIPDCMLGTKGLVIDRSNRECTNFIRHVNSLQLKVNCPFSTVEQIYGKNDDLNMQQVQSFTDRSNLELDL